MLAGMDVERVQSSLAVTRFGEVRWFDEIDSTNTYLLEQAKLGAAEGLVAVTDFQSAGRGRLDRTWIAPPGSSLMFSILLRPLASPEHLFHYTMAMALAVADSCASVANAKVDLKWPNDVMVGDRKLSGILSQSVIEGDRVNALVIGVGINVNWDNSLPDEISQRAIFLSQISKVDVDREKLLVALLTRYDWYLNTDFPHKAVEEFSNRCTTIGRNVQVELDNRVLTGEAKGLTSSGKLILATNNAGVMEIDSGDVVHLR